MVQSPPGIKDADDHHFSPVVEVDDKASGKEQAGSQNECVPTMLLNCNKGNIATVNTVQIEPALVRYRSTV